MLESVKLSLRINNNAYDGEIENLIKACLKELELAGIASSKMNKNDEMIIRAVTLYCKAQFGFDNADADKYQNSYESLKTFLCTNKGYNK